MKDSTAEPIGVALLPILAPLGYTQRLGAGATIRATSWCGGILKRCDDAERQALLAELAYLAA